MSRVSRARYTSPTPRTRRTKKSRRGAGAFRSRASSQIRNQSGFRSLLYFFSPAVQLRIATMGADATPSAGTLIRKRCPSGATS